MRQSILIVCISGKVRLLLASMKFFVNFVSTTNRSISVINYLKALIYI